MKKSTCKFFHQLKLLLWKNYVIKKRSLILVLFELTVPLVLFLIMFAIRINQRARPVDIIHFNAWPLPTAGFVPLMQSFCKPEEHGIRNENGFIEYPNSTANQMLEQIDQIIKSEWSKSWFSNSPDSFSSSSSLFSANLGLKLVDIFANTRSNQSEINSKENYKNDFELKNMLNALEDLSKLSIHFPSSLCATKNSREIFKQSEEKRKNSKPESLINEETISSDQGQNKFKKKLMKNYGFVGLWYSMQKTFCGSTSSLSKNKTNSSPPISNHNQTTINEKEDESFNQFNSLDLSKDQLKALGLIFNVMYSNPMILFSPNTSLIHDNIIRKTNHTFEMLAKINKFSSEWLDLSQSLVLYLNSSASNSIINNNVRLSFIFLNKNIQFKSLSLSYFQSSKLTTLFIGYYLEIG
jgi:hypothetical protein